MLTFQRLYLGGHSKAKKEITITMSAELIKFKNDCNNMLFAKSINQLQSKRRTYRFSHLDYAPIVLQTQQHMSAKVWCGRTSRCVSHEAVRSSNNIKSCVTRTRLMLTDWDKVHPFRMSDRIVHRAQHCTHIIASHSRN